MVSLSRSPAQLEMEQRLGSSEIGEGEISGDTLCVSLPLRMTSIVSMKPPPMASTRNLARSWAARSILEWPIQERPADGCSHPSARWSPREHGVPDRAAVLALRVETHPTVAVGARERRVVVGIAHHAEDVAQG